ncbi:hypothetical protein Scep_026542 [Stephania cephalantha]|uniref:Uncharacterized protein n=1 Tax=Stephania cephalantha TaxID=152367 RepID=A0AAP0EQZ0_9MAGN
MALKVGNQYLQADNGSNSDDESEGGRNSLYTTFSAIIYKEVFNSVAIVAGVTYYVTTLAVATHSVTAPAVATDSFTALIVATHSVTAPAVTTHSVVTSEVPNEPRSYESDCNCDVGDIDDISIRDAFE